MLVNRRELVALAAAGVAAANANVIAPAGQARAASGAKIKAIAFDGFPIIDPRPVAARTEEIFPGRGLELGNAWRTRQFEYTWLRTLGGHYADFWQVTEESLIFAAKLLKIDLSADQRDQLMQSYLTLKAWPDVLPALKALRDAGIRMAFLSNLTDAMLDAAVRNSGLEGFLEGHLSYRQGQGIQARSARLSDGRRRLQTAERGNRICRLRRLGCGRRPVVRISDLLGQSPEPAC